jgi:hypothetical protein
MEQVDHSVYRKGTTPAIEQTAPLHDDDEIAARARKIRALPIGERIYTQGQILGRIRTMEKNVQRGYTDWLPALEAERRLLELTKLGMQ